jgi:uncharacterized protein
MIAVDTNVLVHAHRGDSRHHPLATRAVLDLARGRGSWALPWPCVHEFLAVVTHPRIFPDATPPDLAVSAVEAWVDAGAAVVGESRDHLSIMRRLLGTGAVLGPKVHDARIAAICLGHGVAELWTADRDFSYFPDLRTRNPLVR